MNLTKNLFGIAALSLCLGFASCSDDDELPYSEAQVTNAELRAILEKQGIQFDATGHMLLDDKVQNLTALDLTGTKFTDFQALTILPNLNELDLSNNDLGPVFDFSVLPTQITGVDLTGNDIYDFEGLVDAKVENDEVKTTIKHKLVKLHLSESAKWNVEDLMPFYTQSKAEGTTVDMQMEENGTLKPYTTKREIPDEFFRDYLKRIYSSVFDGDKLDISKYPSMTEGHADIFLWYDNNYENIYKIQSIEGFEYFVNNPYYPSFHAEIGYIGEFAFSTDYLMPRGNIESLNLAGDTPKGIDFSKATAITSLGLKNNPSIKDLDLSQTLIANQETKDYDPDFGNILSLRNCEKLESITFPKNHKGIIDKIALGSLPALKTLDLSAFVAMRYLALIDIPNTKITYPNLKYTFGLNMDMTLVPLAPETPLNFSVSQNVFDMQVTKDYIKSNRSILRDRYTMYRSWGAVRWSRLPL